MHFSLPIPTLTLCIEALEVAGPAGLLLSVVAIGLLAIVVSECISELSQQFPAPNAIVEYVKTFVDKDLGWVVGIAYWYAFASVFAVQNLAAAELSKYWGLSQTFQTLAFYAVAPLVILTLNFFGVFVSWIYSPPCFCCLFSLSGMGLLKPSVEH
jgi:yeast amino acid transporter